MTAEPAFRRAGPVLVGIAAMLWGTVGIASKALYGLNDVSPLTVGFFRLAIAVPILMAWRWRSLTGGSLGFRGRDRAIVASIGTAMAIYQICYFHAVAELGVALTTLATICSAPVLITLLSVAVLREKVTALTLIALIVGLAGTALLLDAPTDRPTASQISGIGWAAGSALAYSVFVLCSRVLARHDPSQIIVVGFGVGALILLPFALVAGIPPASASSVWALLFYVGLVPTAIAYMLYFRGMRETSAIPAGVIGLLEPLTATLLALVLFGEQLRPIGILGVGLLGFSMLVLLMPRREGVRARDSQHS